MAKKCENCVMAVTDNKLGDTIYIWCEVLRTWVDPTGSCEDYAPKGDKL